MKYFNTVGPVNPTDHYFLPHRLDWEELNQFIKNKYYFVLHAPRQSGKTTAVMEFVRHLNTQEKYTGLYVSTETSHVYVNDEIGAMESLLGRFISAISQQLFGQEIVVQLIHDILQGKEKKDMLGKFLEMWAEKNTKPLVLFFDEVDGMMGNALISFLKQLRSGYTHRPKHFPQSVCLIGVRDLRDYKMQTKEHVELGVLYSPFNIKSDSLRLKDFSLEDVRTLYLQHTEETGQKFTKEAIEYAFTLTQGQPWLVNAIGYQACFRDVTDRTQPITKEVIEQAKEALILRRDTHIGALVDRLSEERVRQIIDAVINGNITPQDFKIDDLQYVRDLGLIKQGKLEIANPIYQEIIPRELTYGTVQSLSQRTVDYQNSDGTLNVQILLQKFTEFYRDNSAIWLEKFAYKESGPHLLLMAFLQRIINGGGSIYREYALGRDRVDLLIKWGGQKIVIELKVLRGDKTLTEGLKQTAGYMDACGATEGHLVIFDRDINKPWNEKISQRIANESGKEIHIWML